MQHDIKKFIDGFHQSGRWPRGLNSSFITLIPKIDSPINLNDFRPISLVGCLYKIVTKILASRIKKVLPNVIAMNQFAFLGGRSMLDSVVVANESVHEAKSKKLPTMIFKVDFEKAYDSVRWCFLEYMMRRFNFNERWVSWVMGCLKSSYVSVLVNGSPTGEFKMEKGIRQGDPLAPFLFLMVAEGLNGIMRRAMFTDHFAPLKVGSRDKVDVALLQFADDALFFGEATLQNILTLKCILRCFELTSGLKVNFAKSKLAGVSITATETNRFAALLHCRVMELPFVYLGLPIGGSPRRLTFWEPVIQKLRKRLSSWKSKNLSFGGRVCLVKSVLSALPLYFISCYRMPKGVIKKCNQIMMRFLWGGSEEDRKIAWVSWAQLCKTKAEGGLGIKDLDSFNVALLGKWRWRLLQNQNLLWCRVLLAKYGPGSKSKKSSWWVDLYACCGENSLGNWFDNGICRRIGEGDDTSFWEDNWHGTGKFQEQFVDLYGVSCQQNKKIAEMGQWINGSWTWSLQWNGSVDGELQVQLNEVMRIVSSFSLIQGKKDCWFWTREREGIFTVKSAYEAIFFKEIGDTEECFSLLWKLLAPSNCLAFGWRVLLNRVQTKDNLIRRHVQLSDCLCPLCSSHEETVMHLLFFCQHAWLVWSHVFKWLGINFVQPSSCKEHFVQFGGLLVGIKKVGFMSIWVSVIWHIWQSRNEAVFRGGSLTPEEIFDNCRMRSWEWLRAKCKTFSYSIYEWFNEPVSCLSSF